VNFWLAVTYPVSNSSLLFIYHKITGLQHFTCTFQSIDCTQTTTWYPMMLNLWPRPLTMDQTVIRWICQPH